MSKHTREDVILAMKEMLADMPEGMCYEESLRMTLPAEERGDRMDLCFYRIQDQPACLVGHIAAHMHIPYEENDEGKTVTHTSLVDWYDEDAIRLLDQWQLAQDAQHMRPWTHIMENPGEEWN